MRMLGKMNQPFCGSKCCGMSSKVKSHKRNTKRSERQKWKREVRL